MNLWASETVQEGKVLALQTDGQEFSHQNLSQKKKKDKTVFQQSCVCTRLHPFLRNEFEWLPEARCHSFLKMYPLRDLVVGEGVQRERKYIQQSNG